MVMCETFQWTDATFTTLKPSNTNFRHFATQIWDALPAEKPWYGIEQEYTMLST